MVVGEFRGEKTESMTNSVAVLTALTMSASGHLLCWKVALAASQPNSSSTSVMPGLEKPGPTMVVKMSMGMEILAESWRDMVEN